MRLLPALVLIASLGAVAHAQRGQAAHDGSVTVADSVRIHYRIVGNGPDTVVVLHGGPGLTMDYLAPDLEPLGARHTLVFYDQRGSGRSRAPHDMAHINIANHLSDLDAIRDNFHIARLTILGHSWGGKLAVIYAATHPDRVGRLILEDPGSPKPDPRLIRNLRAWADSGMQEQLNRLARAADDTAGDRLQTCHAFWSVFIRGYFFNPNDTIGIRRMRGDVCSNATAMDDLNRTSALTLASVGARDYAADLSAVRSPVLVITGRQDPLPLENSQMWAARLPDARLLVVEKSGHFPHVEHPQLFFGAVEAFLRGDWPAGAVKVDR